MQQPVSTMVDLRPMKDGDLPFLAELYASTRREELEAVGWSDEEKRTFLQTQFEYQHRYYIEHYRTCQFLVIEQAGRPIGRLYVDRWPAEIRIVDISLLPEARGGGIGSALLRMILEEGAASRLPVSIHVEYNNPAKRLYERLGFRDVDTNGVYMLMRWSPA